MSITLILSLEYVEEDRRRGDPGVMPCGNITLKEARLTNTHWAKTVSTMNRQLRYIYCSDTASTCVNRR
jgi:hypothetical protein